MKGMKGTLLAYFTWLCLGAGSAYCAWLLHTLAILGIDWIVRTPSLRPIGWSDGTVATFSRLSILIFGSLWLIYVLWLENRLQAVLLRSSSHFWATVRNTAVGLVILFAVTTFLIRYLALPA